jgi:hypothetical protein
VPVDEPGRVVVAGGGVAGLSAAREAARRGHDVVLFERRSVLGGRAHLAGVRSGRDRWDRFVDWLRDESEALGVEIRLGLEADAPTVLAERPDAVIVATGSMLRPEARLPGPVPVLDVDELLEGVPLPDPSTGTALVLDDDGHQLAPTAAEVLIAAGFVVEIATTHPAVGDLIDDTQLPFVLQRLARDRVRVTPNVMGVSSSEGALTLRHLYSEEEERREGVGLVVVTGRRQGVTALRDELAAAAPDLPVIVVGDALSPRYLLDAVAEGAKAGVTVLGGARTRHHELLEIPNDLDLEGLASIRSPRSYW